MAATRRPSRPAGAPPGAGRATSPVTVAGGSIGGSEGRAGRSFAEPAGPQGPRDDMAACDRLVAELRACRLCESRLPQPPRPVVQLHPQARIVIAGQAPGRLAHERGRPFDDPSGDRLRHWMGIDRDTFYDPRCVAVLPMAFCFPGSSPRGDLPPPAACAPAWQARVLQALPHRRLMLVVGRFALHGHFGGTADVADHVAAWRQHAPGRWPLPHPSPRNRGWLLNHPWFEDELLPALRRAVKLALE